MPEQQKNMVINSQQSLEMRIENLRRHEVEWHRKFTISIACLLFLFLGAPLGAIIRKGGLGLPLIISVVFFHPLLHFITHRRKTCETKHIARLPGYVDDFRAFCNYGSLYNL
jgi:hypothetical protein